MDSRVFPVGFDKNDIKFGDDWRRGITDGITGSRRVQSFLAKHSTRAPPASASTKLPSASA